MHWCQDETNALFAAVPFLGYICLKCKLAYYKLRGKKQAK